MSKINILGIVNEIKGHINIYTPIIEAIVNSIQSIEESKNSNGKIRIVVERENTMNLSDESLPEITDVVIIDNGVGFTDKNRDSFDTFRGDNKKLIGGKGFGRFMYLKFFNSVSVQSTYAKESKYYNREFRFGKKFNIIEK